MRRKEPVSTQVYRQLFPNPTHGTDPPSWLHHVKNNLVAEIRHCTRNFYGEHESLEARYPGLDYNSPLTTRRFARYPHHRKLFHTFKILGLTPFEIYELCNWEGTLYVQRRFEKEHGRKIEDTTGADVPLWQEPARRDEHCPIVNIPLPQIRLNAEQAAEMGDDDEQDEGDESGEVYDAEFEHYTGQSEDMSGDVDENKSDGEDEDDENHDVEPQTLQSHNDLNQNLFMMSTHEIDQFLLEQQRHRQQQVLQSQQQYLQNQQQRLQQEQQSFHASVLARQHHAQLRENERQTRNQLARDVLVNRRTLPPPHQMVHEQRHYPQQGAPTTSLPHSYPTSESHTHSTPPLTSEQMQAHLDYLRNHVRRMTTPGSGINIDETFRYLEQRGVPWDLLLRTVNDALFQHAEPRTYS